MFFPIAGFRRRVTDAGRGMLYCPVCKRTQQFALKRIARYFTLCFIPIARAGGATEYAICLGCRHASRRGAHDAAFVASRLLSEKPTLGYPAVPTDAAPQVTPRPAAALACFAQPAAVSRPAFGQSAFAKATYARQRRPAPGLGAPAPSGPSFFTPRR